MERVCLKRLSSLSSKAAFGDVAAYLITNEASLDALNEELPMPISMTRFRPNIVVRGLKAWEEVFYFLSTYILLLLQWPGCRIILVSLAGFGSHARCSPLPAHSNKPGENIRTINNLYYKITKIVPAL